ncbi:MAG: OmpH family outer membrane protein [Phycisphaerae bacterium]|nr:OmpH family outer membrane protein [Phycisphaerae bacterium]
MKSKWITLVICGAFTMPGRASAQEKNVNVAVVNLSHLFERYVMTKDLEAKFEGWRTATAAEAEKKRSAVESRRKDLVALKPESKQFDELEQEITRMEIEYEVWVTQQEKAIKNNHKRWLMRIYKDVREAVAAIALDAKIDLVLTYEQLTEDVPDSNALRQQILLQKIIYFDNRIDLTQAVLARINQKYEKAGGAANLQLSQASPFRESRIENGELRMEN